MSAVDEIKKELQKVRNKYTYNILDLISDYKNEEKTKIDYRGRQIFELLQNADDSYDQNNPESQVEVSIELREDSLIIQNSGIAFVARGIASLMHPDASSKHTGTIGSKGLGFRSVLNWSKDITICTNEFVVNFSEEKAIEDLEYYKTHGDTDHLEELDEDGIIRAPILSAVTILEDTEFKKTVFDSHYATSIVLKCDKTTIESIENELKTLQFEELMFLKHICSITIKTPSLTRKIECIKDSNDCIIQDDFKTPTSWQLFTKSGTIKQNDGKDKYYELSIAYPEDPDARVALRNNGKLYSYFKTDVQMPFPFIVHGTFELSSERNQLTKESKNNEELFKELAKFIGEVALKIASKEAESSYSPLQMMIPSIQYFAVNDLYKIRDLLVEEIKSISIFPSISGSYIGLNDKPHFHKQEFADYLNKDTFKSLLKKCNDDTIINVLWKLGVGKYTENEMVDLINNDGDEYVKANSNAELIKLFINDYPNCTRAPSLLVNSSGVRVLDSDVKLFSSTSNQFSLPDWASISFIDKALEDKLEDLLNCHTARSLAEKTKVFGYEEYSFKKVLAAINSQVNSDIDRAKNVIKWMHDSWEQISSEMSSTEKTYIDVLTRDGTLAKSNKCFIGSEYGNDLGERIVSKLSEKTFIASLEEYGLTGCKKETLEKIFIELGSKKFPLIEVSELNNEDAKTFIELNKGRFDKLEVSQENNLLTYEELFYQKCRVFVSDIEEFDKILNESSFEDIISWALLDETFKKCITSELEPSISARMIGKQKSKIYDRTVQSSYMVSWLRNKILSLNWIPTESGKRVSARDVTIKKYALSPVIETAKINYKEIQKNFPSFNIDKEVDALIYRMGIADDISSLPKEKIYDILMVLPNFDTLSNEVVKAIYTNLNTSFDAENTKKIISNNKSYNVFCENGKVLVRLHQKNQWEFAKDSYYVGRKMFSQDILDNYPVLVLNRRAGDEKIESLFGVKRIQSIGNIDVKDIELHPLADSYKEEFKKLLPYLYSKRVASDKTRRDLGRLRNCSISLVSSITTEYKVHGEIKQGTLNDFEMLYREKVIYIKVPSYVETIDDLRGNMKFKMAVAEAITTILDVDAEKDPFVNILGCHSIQEVEAYLKENGDDDLMLVKLANEKFNIGIDYKKEFWDAISRVKSITCSELFVHYNIDPEFKINFRNPSENPEEIIALFKLIEIEIDDYNSEAYSTIDLRKYWIKQFGILKNSYKEKYLYYLALDCEKNDLSKAAFNQKKDNFIFLELTFDNSVQINLIDELETNIGIKLSSLDELNGDYKQIYNTLTEEVETPKETINEKQKKEETDFESLYNELKQENNDSIEDIQTIAAPEHNKAKGNSGGKGGKSYDNSSNETKLKDGFIAEAKVFLTLKNRKDIESVAWVSGNAEKAHEIEKGDDSLGYDIKYSIDGVIHYVEVKGTCSNSIEFTMTKNEFSFAKSHPNDYELLFVFIVGGKATSPKNLGNIMIFKDGEDFFHNSNFKVEQSDFKVKAIVKED